MKKFLFFLLFLTGCGWTPLYHQADNPLLDNAKINVKPIPNQYGAKMRQVIQNSFPISNNEASHSYQIVVQSPSFSSGNKTITNDEFASMMQVTARAPYLLINTKTGKTVFSDVVSSVGSYAVAKDPYATTIAKNRIQEELSEELAQQIALNLLAKLSQETP